MRKGYTAVALLIGLAAVLVAVGVLYQTGHLQLATSADGKHPKHAVVAYGAALVCLVGASFARPRQA